MYFMTTNQVILSFYHGRAACAYVRCENMQKEIKLDEVGLAKNLKQIR